MIYERYVDDVLMDIAKNTVPAKLESINSLNDSLKFTAERENDCNIPFLDMLIKQKGRTLSSTWYTKKTDTGLMMNFLALAPIRYKRAVISGMIHRIYRSCSSWKLFHQSLEKAKVILINNQYPPSFFNPIIEKSLTKIIEKPDKEEDESDKKKFFIQYRGKVSDKFENTLKRIDAPCKVIFTTRKLKTVLPSLKPEIEKPLRSSVVYLVKCPRCNSRYVGQTVRHLITRSKEHSRSPVGKHFLNCNKEISIDDFSIIGMSTKGEQHLMTLEALFIKDLKPELNKKDEYKSRALVLKI